MQSQAPIQLFPPAVLRRNGAPPVSQLIEHHAGMVAYPDQLCINCGKVERGWAIEFGRVVDGVHETAATADTVLERLRLVGVLAGGVAGTVVPLVSAGAHVITYVTDSSIGAPSKILEAMLSVAQGVQLAGLLVPGIGWAITGLLTLAIGGLRVMEAVRYSADPVGGTGAAFSGAVPTIGGLY